MVNLEDVHAEIIRLNGTLPIGALLADSWQAIHLVQELGRKGVSAYSLAQTSQAKDEQARSLLRAVQDGLLQLYPDENLQDELRKITLVERANGQLRIDAPRDQDGHCDLVSALAIVLPDALEILEQGPELSPESHFDSVFLA